MFCNAKEVMLHCFYYPKKIETHWGWRRFEKVSSSASCSKQGQDWIQTRLLRALSWANLQRWGNVSPTPCLNPCPLHLLTWFQSQKSVPSPLCIPSKELSFVPSMTFPRALGAAVGALWNHLSSRLNTVSCPSLFSQGIRSKTQTEKEEQHPRCNPECFSSFPVPSGSRTTLVQKKQLIHLCVHVRPGGFLIFLKQNKLATRPQKIQGVSLTTFQLH